MNNKITEHEHQHGDSCGCGHDHGHEHSHGEHHEHEHKHQHDDSCGCGHDHGHEHGEHHEHDDSCGCGHDHSHDEHHEHGDSCGCGHEHSHGDHHEHSHEHHDHEHHRPSAPLSSSSRVYLLEHLSCANCAAKMERKINEMPEVSGAVITFATKQLRVDAKSYDGLLEKMQQICASIEPDVIITEKTAAKKPAAEHSHGFSEQKKEALMIAAGALLFAAGELIGKQTSDFLYLGLFVASYLILGGNVLLTAGKNLKNGHVFDENFLMSIATLGAFATGAYPEAAGVMLFYRIGELFEDIAVARSRSQIMDAVDMRPETVARISDGGVQIIPAEDAVVGDRIQIRPGDRIPLDSIVVEGESLIDTSPVTGEPVPVTVKPGSSVISGCINTSGLLAVQVEKALEESMVTKILDSVENAVASKPKIDRFITRFARIYTPIVVLLAAATAIVPSLITGDWNRWIYTALTFLVISCPCALVLSVPLAFFSGIGAGSKRGILFKGGVALEALADVKAIVMDKTGTITKGNFILQKAVSLEADISADELLSLAASCEKNSSHPIAVSIVTASDEKQLPVLDADSVTEHSGKGLEVHINGRTIYCGSKKLMDEFHINTDSYTGNSFGTEVLIGENGRLLGYLVISDTIKEEAPDAIASIKKQRIITAMLTGDAKESADAVAAQTGIDEVHARLLPQDKLSRLQDIRSRHGAVMFVGDGVNDAPVLAGADVGAAMGSGADAAIEAADVVFMTSSMDAIPQALSIAKDASLISRQNIIFALITKVLVMILGLAGFASMWMAVFADTGVAVLCVLNSVRILYKKH